MTPEKRSSQGAAARQRARKALNVLMSDGSRRAPKRVRRPRAEHRIQLKHELGPQAGRNRRKRARIGRKSGRGPARLTDKTAGHLGRGFIAGRCWGAIWTAIVLTIQCGGAHLGRPHLGRRHRAIGSAHGVRHAADGERDNHKQREPELAHCPIIFDLDHQLVKGPRLLLRIGWACPLRQTCVATTHHRRRLAPNCLIPRRAAAARSSACKPRPPPGPQSWR